MQKQHKHYHRSHHVRISAVAIALACGFHVAGITHMQKSGQRETALNFTRALADHMERENETSRHMVRFDEGMRLPSISGGEA